MTIGGIMNLTDYGFLPQNYSTDTERGLMQELPLCLKGAIALLPSMVNAPQN